MAGPRREPPIARTRRRLWPKGERLAALWHEPSCAAVLSQQGSAVLSRQTFRNLVYFQQTLRQRAAHKRQPLRPERHRAKQPWHEKRAAPRLARARLPKRPIGPACKSGEIGQLPCAGRLASHKDFPIPPIAWQRLIPKWSVAEQKTGPILKASKALGSQHVTPKARPC